MERKILSANAPSLREKSKQVSKIDKKIKVLISDMKATLLSQKDPQGVGLAAPQIGKNVRLFIIKPEKTIKTIINPKILEISKEKPKKPSTKETPMEGCLSVPNFYGPLTRAKRVKIQYLNEKGERLVEEFRGLGAQIVLHEIDHLNGILFIDHLLEQKLPLFEYKNGEWLKIEI